MRRLARSVAALFVAIGAAAPASAQLAATVEGAGSRIAYDSSAGLSVASVTPSLDWAGPSASLAATGSFAQFSGGGWTLQGAGSGSVYTASAAGFMGELAGSATGSTYQLGGSASELLVHGRLHWTRWNAGVWAGGAIGPAWNGVAWQTDRRGEAGVWLRRSGLTLTATGTPTWIGQDLALVDAGLAASLARGQVELAGFTGVRHWSRPAGTAGSTWGGGSAAFWLDPHVAIVAAGGSFPADYAQGFTGGSYLSLGLRLASRRTAREVSVPIGARPAPDAAAAPGTDLGVLAPVVRAFEVGASGAGRRTINIDAPAARSVEIMGDFTQWRPVSLTQGPGGVWSVTLALEPGVYRMNVRVDGGAWGVPPGLPALGDEFGGAVGVLQIEGP